MQQGNFKIEKIFSKDMMKRLTKQKKHDKPVMIVTQAEAEEAEKGFQKEENLAFSS